MPRAPSDRASAIMTNTARLAAIQEKIDVLMQISKNSKVTEKAGNSSAPAVTKKGAVWLFSGFGSAWKDIGKELRFR